MLSYTMYNLSPPHLRCWANISPALGLLTGSEGEGMVCIVLLPTQTFAFPAHKYRSQDL